MHSVIITHLQTFPPTVGTRTDTWGERWQDKCFREQEWEWEKESEDRMNGTEKRAEKEESQLKGSVGGGTEGKEEMDD